MRANRAMRALIQTEPGHGDSFIDEIVADARGSVNDQPGCLRLDVTQDANEPNRIWLYEDYKDEAASQDHLRASHFIKWRDGVKEWQR